MIRLSPFALAAAVLATSVTVAAASPSAAATAVRVSYADLDLSSATGRATLDSRLDRAVSKVCFSADQLDLGNVRACRLALREQAQSNAKLAYADSVTRMAAR